MATKKSRAPLIVDEITLDGKKIQVRTVDLPIADVRLDPRNPRIANTVQIEPQVAAKREKFIEDLLWEDTPVRELYRQVRANKGLIERIIVRADGTVAEGNCRTVVYRKLNEKFPEESAWKMIPARVLPDDIGDRAVSVLLGEMHVAGKNSWSAFEKAGHIYQMHKDFGLTQDEIAQRLRMSKSKVNQLIRSFDAMVNEYLTKFPGPASIRKFSYFVELFKKPALRTWVAEEDHAIEKFSQWVGESRLSKGTQVRDLPAILDNTDALRALEKKGYENARKILEEQNPALKSPLFRRMQEMTDALTTAQLGEIQLARTGGNPEARAIVRGLRDEVKRFADFCGLKK